MSVKGFKLSDGTVEQYDYNYLANKPSPSGDGLTADLKAALDQLAQKVAYIDADGQDYYDALHNALYPPANLSSISCVYTQSGPVYDTASLDSLKPNLVVTGHYSNGTTQIITTYTLSGTLAEGTSTITVTYGGKSTTFTVIVTVYSTAPVIMTEGVCWSNTAPNTTAKEGFGITQWYDYNLPQEVIEASPLWDATNQYMTQNGWLCVKFCTPDYLTLQAGYTWPASANFKNVVGKDHVFTAWNSITRNSVFNFNWPRYNTTWIDTNCFSFSLPLLDLDYCFAYWAKGAGNNSLFPTGIKDGDIVYAGKYTPYYNLENIDQAPTLSTISATFTQGSTVVTTSTALNDLKPMLSVTATYSDNKTLPVNLGMVTLSGTLSTGTSTITATYNNKTTTFDVTVS